MTTDLIEVDQRPVEALDIATEIDVAGMHLAMAAMRNFVAGELKENVHFGTVPGVPKKFLWLPGAEQILRGFNCRPEYSTVNQMIDPNSGYFMFWRKCRAINIATGKVVGEADAICTSDEFIDRNGSPLDFSKSLPNGLMKADKRAMVKAARTLGCTSEFFTQDEELVQGGGSTYKPIAAATQPSDKWPNNWAEEREGQWWIQCPKHGMSKARFWPANARGGENVACTRKDGDIWCKNRVTMQQIRQQVANSMPVVSEDEPTYDYED